MSNSPNLGMPFLSVSQASKEITHNEALVILDILAQGRITAAQTAPPGSPTNGAGYIVTATATGAWVGQETKIAYWMTDIGVWRFVTPKAGWIVWLVSESDFYRYTGSAWIRNQPLNNLTATVDPTVNDDSADGYSVGSYWYNQNDEEAFKCLDATVGAAVWIKVSLTIDELGDLALLDTVDTDQIDDEAVTVGKMHATQTDILFGRETAGDGPAEEIALTAAGRALLDDADAAAQRATLEVDQSGSLPRGEALYLLSGGF